MEVQLRLIGILLIVLALLHSIFPKYFNWSAEFQKVSLINRQMMYVHTFFIALALFLMGLLCLIFPVDLIQTRLGHAIASGLGLFWTARLLIQFLGYSPALWKGKRFETIIHILFSLLWLYLSSTFWYISLRY